jgi:glycerophosphoryl diester phosphodiesterase
LRRGLGRDALPAGPGGRARQCHRGGIKAMIWTVNDDRAIGRWLADPRVDVVVTDRPGHAAMLRNRLGRARSKS